MTVIRPNSISGVTSITAMANEINVFKHDGVLAGLQLNGVNHHTSSGVSTFHTLNVLGNVSVGGTLTYQDVTNVDSVGIITARDTIDAQGSINLADSIIHTGDIDTKIAFTNNQIDLQCAGSSRAYINNYALYVSSGFPLAFLASSGATPNIKSGGTNNQDLLFTTGTGNPTRLQIHSGGQITVGTPTSNTSDRFTIVDPGNAFMSLRSDAEADGNSQIIDFAVGTANRSSSNLVSTITASIPTGAAASGTLKGYLAFSTNSGDSLSERLRITAGGQVRVGNTDITTASAADDLIIGPNTPAGDHGITIISGTSGTGNIYFGDTNTSATGNRMGTITYSHNDNYFRFSTNGNNEKLRITSDGKVGINENAPENQLHIAGTTGSSAGGLLRLDATTGDNFIIFDNTGDNSEWVIGNDSGNNDEFRMYYNSGSGYGDPIINVDGTPSNGKVTIDGGTSTLVNVRANSSGTAGLRCGGQAGAGNDQCTGYVEVHQDESHGGGFFYNGDASPSFASSNESADFFSIHRLSAGQRHVVQRWFHSNNDCEMFGNLLIDNGNTTTLTVRGNSSGTAGVRAGGSAGSGNSQCTGYLEAHQDEGHGGGISYNGDGTPSFVNNETADHITFYRLSGGTRERVFSYPYNSNAVSFRGGITAPSKSFRITHPHPSKKDTHDLIHSSIEGPQCDNIYRGKVDLVGGTATVNIDTVSNMTDGTFVLLNRDIQCFTSNETGWTNVKGSVTGNLLTIIAQENSCTDTISWMVVGERQDDDIKSEDVETTDADGKLIVELLKGS